MKVAICDPVYVTRCEYGSYRDSLFEVNGVGMGVREVKSDVIDAQSYKYVQVGRDLYGLRVATYP